MRLFGLILMLAIGLPAQAARYDSPTVLISAYLDFLERGERGSAESCWLAGELEQSRRLGIHFTDEELKVDCASPLLPLLPDIRTGRYSIEVEEIRLDGNDRARITLVVRGGEIEPRIQYEAKLTEHGWRLASPLMLDASHWPVIETRFLRVHCDEPSRLNSIALAEADSFVLATARLLSIGAARLVLLERDKIDYYLCTDEQILELSGFRTHGITNLALDAVLSVHLPHHHELAHVLINFALADVPILVLPALQEGFAVAVGGRWEKSPEVVLELGAYLMEQDPGAIDDLFTESGFRDKIGMPDISYPMSGLLVRSLIETAGAERFLEIYRESAGARKTGAAELLFPDVSDPARLLRDYAGRLPSSGIDPPGGELSGSPSLTLRTSGMTITIWGLGVDWEFEVRFRGGKPAGAILFTPGNVPVDTTYKSDLYSRHFPDRIYQGEHYALRFDTKEAGLYDYYVNRLEAKYVKSFRPSERYWEHGRGIIRFRLDRSKIAGDLRDYRLTPLATGW